MLFDIGLYKKKSERQEKDIEKLNDKLKECNKVINDQKRRIKVMNNALKVGTFRNFAIMKNMNDRLKKEADSRERKTRKK